MTELNKKLGFLFHDVARFRTILLDSLMQPYGLTRAQTYVLAHVMTQDGLTQTELANRMELGTVTLSGLIDRMEAKEWLKREPDPEDRRAKRIWLQPKGKAVRKTINKQANELNRISLKGLSEDKIDDLVEMLKLIKGNLSTEIERRSDRPVREKRGKPRAAE